MPNLGGISTAPTHRSRAAALVLSEGALVASWPDDFGGAPWAEATDKPTFRSDAMDIGPAVEFDGAGKKLSVAFAPGTTNGYTFFLVMRPYHQSVMALSTDTAPDFYIGCLGDGTTWNKMAGQGAVSPAPAQDCADQVIGFSYNRADGKLRIWRNGFTAEAVAAGALAYTDTVLQLGVYDGLGATISFAGLIRDVVRYEDVDLSSADLDAVGSALVVEYGLDTLPALLVLGDSICAQIAQFYTPRGYAAVAAAYGHTNNFSVGGAGVASVGADQVPLLAADVDGARRGNVAYCAVLTNNIASAAGTTYGTPAAAAAAYKTLLQNIRAAGASHVVAATVLPRSDVFSGGQNAAGFESDRNAINVIIRSWAGDGTYDALADYAADPTMGPQAAASDPTLYDALDGTHPTLLGSNTYLAPVFVAAIDSLTFGPAVHYATTPVTVTEGVAIGNNDPTTDSGSPTSYAITTGSKPSWMTFSTSTGRFSGTPPLGTGTVTVTLGITPNDGVTDGAETPFVVNVVLALPIASWPTPLSLITGSSPSIAPTNTGGAFTGAAEVAGATNVLNDANLQINATTGVITAKAGGVGAVGPYSFKVKLTNATGNSNTVTLVWTSSRGGSDAGGAIATAAMRPSAEPQSAMKPAAFGGRRR